MMTPTLRISQFGEYLSRHVVDVFSTVLSLPATLSDLPAAAPASERVSGFVGFVGESVTGTICLHFSSAFARRATSALLGLTVDEITSKAEVNGAVGELANLLSGGLKAWLNQTGVACAMSAPAIVRGTSFGLEPMPDMEREILVFECQGELVLVEILVQFS